MLIDYITITHFLIVAFSLGLMTCFVLLFVFFNQEGNGFIEIVKIPTFLEKLGSPCASMNADLFTKEFDPDGMGLALWNRMEAGVDNLEKIRQDQAKLDADWAW
jgi:hypothetical protein